MYWPKFLYFLKAAKILFLFAATQQQHSNNILNRLTTAIERQQDCASPKLSISGCPQKKQ